MAQHCREFYVGETGDKLLGKYAMDGKAKADITSVALGSTFGSASPGSKHQLECDANKHVFGAGVRRKVKTLTLSS